jgi:hypothetical protein
LRGLNAILMAGLKNRELTTLNHPNNVKAQVLRVNPGLFE